MRDSGAPPILALDDVMKAFGGVNAVAGLTMSVPAGAIHGLIGPNGAGKTTAINLISGLTHPTSGTIRLGGDRVDGLQPHRIAALGVARTFQNIRLFSGMTSLELVMCGCWLRRGVSLWASFLGLPSASAAWRAARERAMHLLDRVAMADRAHALGEMLSYGEQRRIEIARALGSAPRLLLLDEPTAGMNAAEADDIGRLIRALRDDGLTILMVEHNIKLVAAFCDTCTVMNFGRVLVEGAPKECLSDPAVQEAYFGRRGDADRLKTLR